MRKLPKGAPQYRDSPQYSYLEALVKSFYSAQLYIDVARRWRGFSSGYFLLLMGLVSIPWGIYYSQLFSTYIQDEWIYPFGQMPQVLIQNGNTFIDKPVPYFIPNKAGIPIIEIDTNSKETGFSDKNPTVSVMITKNQIFFRAPIDEFIQKLPFAQVAGQTQPKRRVTQYTFKESENQVFSGPDWVKMSGVQSLPKYAMIIVYPISFGLLFSLYLVLNFVLASVGRILSLVVIKYKINFLASLRLVWVSSTAPTLFLNIQKLSGFALPGEGLYYSVLVICYFSYAVVCLKNEKRYLVGR
jgi:hypothetical protein